jgi:uncharacterized C2H2 Zn-finger protein
MAKNGERFSCDLCDKTFSAAKSVYRHKRVNHNLIVSISGKNECEYCSETFRQHADLMKHIQEHHKDDCEDEEVEELHFPSFDGTLQ